MLGFSHTHFSGIDRSDFGDLLIQSKVGVAHTKPGFFLSYLADTYEPDLVYKFNLSALTFDDWSFEKAIQSIIVKPINSLW